MRVGNVCHRRHVQQVRKCGHLNQLFLVLSSYLYVGSKDQLRCPDMVVYMRAALHRLRDLNAWSPAFAAVRGEFRTLGGRAFLEETGHTGLESL